jgi:hypothetical protein
MTRRHLDVIGAERIERSIAADPNCDAAVRDDALGTSDARQGASAAVGGANSGIPSIWLA